MGKYKKRSDGRYATTVMVGYKPDGKPNNIFLSAKTEKELKEKIVKQLTDLGDYIEVAIEEAA